ncbi:arylamine N-acetyltransferase family protein [Pseudalkalibacillus sp. Hm43]|uniref:arylamine N-acetyltransferase family protein n=1 Tax=Pseudalkalibacillus sp. Hm43 TaxID=3450742 RepID=UPI003F4203CB
MNELFRKRIGISSQETVDFHNLEQVLQNLSRTIPFENIRIMQNKTQPLTEDYLIDKLLINEEGGLCYELNPLLYLFLIENGFEAYMVRGVVLNGEPLGRTHVAILLIHNSKKYLVDTGFGGNLPLKPVPLSGEKVTSSNGEFFVKKSENDLGDYTLELKLKHKDKDWRAGYTFDSTEQIEDVTAFNDIQKTIIEHEKSPFNKNPLLTRLTENGRITLTDTTLTRWDHGQHEKVEVKPNQFQELSKKHFKLDTEMME